MSQQTPYQILGEAGVRNLAAALYDVMNELPEAAPIRAMHGEDLTEIKEKLFQYLSGWLGGPHLYYQKYGTVCLHKPHSRYAIGAAERDQWLLCMEKALERTGASDELKAMLKEPLFRIADTLRTQ
jgi:hemoglobin